MISFLESYHTRITFLEYDKDKLILILEINLNIYKGLNEIIEYIEENLENDIDYTKLSRNNSN